MLCFLNIIVSTLSHTGRFILDTRVYELTMLTATRDKPSFSFPIFHIEHFQLPRVGEVNRTKKMISGQDRKLLVACKQCLCQRGGGAAGGRFV